MNVPTVSNFKVTMGDVVGAARSPQQEPEFHNHGVAIARQREMTKRECLEYILQAGEATISHW